MDLRAQYEDLNGIPDSVVRAIQKAIDHRKIPPTDHAKILKIVRGRVKTYNKSLVRKQRVYLLKKQGKTPVKTRKHIRGDAIVDSFVRGMTDAEMRAAAEKKHLELAEMKAVMEQEIRNRIRQEEELKRLAVEEYKRSIENQSTVKQSTVKQLEVNHELELELERQMEVKRTRAIELERERQMERERKMERERQMELERTRTIEMERQRIRAEFAKEQEQERQRRLEEQERQQMVQRQKEEELKKEKEQHMEAMKKTQNRAKVRRMDSQMGLPVADRVLLNDIRYQSEKIGYPIFNTAIDTRFNAYKSRFTTPFPAMDRNIRSFGCVCVRAYANLLDSVYRKGFRRGDYMSEDDFEEILINKLNSLI
jgi:hypothetical protein